MSERMRGILISLVAIIALAIIAYYASGGTFTVRNALEDISEEEITEEKSTTTDKLNSENIGGEKAGLFEETTEKYKITANYPTSGVGHQKVREYVFGEIESFKDDATGSYMEIAPPRQHVYKSTSEKFITQKYVSYKVMTYLYRGGANGVGLVKTFVFTKEGRPVALEGLLSEDEKGELLRQVREQVREVNEIPPEEELSFRVTYEDIKNFIITDTSLVLLFDEYAVAPGALGVVSIEIDKSFLE